MKKNIKILVCYHKKDNLFKNEVLVPIHCGRALACEASKDGKISEEDYRWMLDNMIGDDTGDNISDLNREFNEMTAIYWAWKNYDKLGNPDYIGLNHYRRLFNIDFNNLDKLLEKYYFIKTAHAKAEKSLYDDWRMSKKEWTDNEYLDKALECSKQLNIELGKDIEKFFKSGIQGGWCNIFILPRDEFFKYCEFIFNILFKLPKPKKVLRTAGMFIERLTSYYLYKLSQNHSYLDVGYVDHLPIFKKEPFIQKIFSIKNQTHKFKKYKVITIAGLKIKIHKKSKLEKLLARKYDPNLSLKDKKYIIEHQFEQAIGYKPNLDNPKTFNEKLNWLKLNYENSLMSVCADKVRARDYFLEKTGAAPVHLVKQYGIYHRPEEIDFSSLPEQFVLKSNWGSGLQLIVKDKKSLEFEKVKNMMESWLKKESNHYYYSFETGYRDIKPMIVCEELLDFEYKLEFFCFNGKPEMFWIVFDDKTPNTSANFYSLNWEKLPIVDHYPNFDKLIEKPVYFDKMLQFAQNVCKSFPFVRCDFYKTKDSFKFSELTFFHWAGLEKFEPEEWDYKLGKMLTLPTSQNVGGGQDCLSDRIQKENSL